MLHTHTEAAVTNTQVVSGLDGEGFALKAEAKTTLEALASGVWVGGGWKCE